MTAGAQADLPGIDFRNALLDSYFVPWHGHWLAVTEHSCFKLSNSMKEVICRLPRKGPAGQYLEEIRALGVPEAERTLGKLASMNCLVPESEGAWYRKLARTLLHPSVELLSSRRQEKMLPLLMDLELKGEMLFLVSLLCCFVGLVLSAVALAGKGMPSSSVVALGPAENLMVFFLILLGIIVHELGHSVAAHLNGIGLRPIGFSLYLMYPVFYTNVSGIGQLPIKRKISITLAGLAMQSLFLAGLFIVWGVTLWPVCLAAIQAHAFLFLFNFNPLINTDGYWCYKDIVAAYRDSRSALLAERVFGVAALFFTGYLLYGAWKIIVSVLDILRSPDRTLGGTFGALIMLYVLFIMLRGMAPRLKESFASITGASIRPAPQGPPACVVAAPLKDDPRR